MQSSAYMVHVVIHLYCKVTINYVQMLVIVYILDETRSDTKAGRTECEHKFLIVHFGILKNDIKSYMFYTGFTESPDN